MAGGLAPDSSWETVLGLPELLVLGTRKGPPWFWVHDWVQVWFLEIEDKL